MTRSAPLHILLTGNFEVGEKDAWQQALALALPHAVWHLDASDDHATLIEVAVVADPRPGVLAGLPRLRFVQSLWAGVEGLMADASLPADVPVARMVDPAMSAAMAETALWACLSLHRGFFTYARQQASGVWRQWPQKRADEVTVAVLGLGRMGSAVARRLAAQGYRVEGWASTHRSGHDGAVEPHVGPHVGSHVEPHVGSHVGSHLEPHVGLHVGRDALPSLLATSDIVVNLLPLTPATRGLLDRTFFSAMKPQASIVNLARGLHVVDDDLLAALATGQVSHAVLDVFDQEPLAAYHPFWTCPAVTVLPHAAAMTDVRSAATIAAGNVTAWIEGRPVHALVDRSRGY
jgi:glyoxylate/hydroxypyruvate reductase A